MTAKTGKALEALKAEVEDRPKEHKFTHDGVEYSFSSDILDDVEVVEAFSDKNTIGMVRAILGPTQWSRYKSKKRTMADLTSLTEAIFNEYGTPAGE